jgi:hypothetical protein
VLVAHGSCGGGWPGALRDRGAVAFALRVPFPPKVLLPLQWAAFLWLGLAFYVIRALLVLEPVRAVARLWLRDRDLAPTAGEVPAPPPPAGTQEQTRRLLLARGLAAAAGTVALATAGVGVRAANGAPVVRRPAVILPRLNPSLDGFRIVTRPDGPTSPATPLPRPSSPRQGHWSAHRMTGDPC